MKLKKSFPIAVTAVLATALLPGVAAADEVRTLYAGQNIEVGTVTVASDTTEVCVTYQLDGYALSDGWLINETHLYVGTDDSFPLTPAKGQLGQPYYANPVPGKFPYGEDFDPGVEMAKHCIDLDDLGVESGDSLFVAAHASIAGYIADSGNVYGVSDTTTTLIPGGGFAFEAYVHPAWNTNLTEPLYDTATWIWSAFYAEDPVNGGTATFEKTFSLPGAPTGGTLSIAADNEFVAYLNDQELGSYNGGWQNVQSFDMSSYLVEGDNTFKFVVTNWPQANGTVYSNPAGLIFKFDADWADVQAESAWAAGSRFNEKGNWGTWFTCGTTYVLNITSVNNNTGFTHHFTISYDAATGETSGTGFGDQAGQQTLSDFAVTADGNGMITKISFKSVYDSNGYTWYPSFELNSNKTLTFIDGYGSDNVTTATGTWKLGLPCE